MRFPVAIHKDDERGYGATCLISPVASRPGTRSKRPSNPFTKPLRVISKDCSWTVEPIPEQVSLETHQTSEAHQDGMWALADVDVSKLTSRAKRVNITVPARVLAIVDEAAAREGDTRSGLHTRAALSYVAQRSMKP